MRLAHVFITPFATCVNKYRGYIHLPSVVCSFFFGFCAFRWVCTHLDICFQSCKFSAAVSPAVRCLLPSSGDPKTVYTFFWRQRWQLGHQHRFPETHRKIKIPNDQRCKSIFPSRFGSRGISSLSLELRLGLTQP